MANAIQKFCLLARFSRSSLGLLRSKGPVAAHSGAVGVGGYHPEMVVVCGVKPLTLAVMLR